MTSPFLPRSFRAIVPRPPRPEALRFGTQPLAEHRKNVSRTFNPALKRCAHFPL